MRYGRLIAPLEKIVLGLRPATQFFRINLNLLLNFKINFTIKALVKFNIRKRIKQPLSFRRRTAGGISPGGIPRLGANRTSLGMTENNHGSNQHRNIYLYIIILRNFP
mgnify:CR=1 FL=1